MSKESQCEKIPQRSASIHSVETQSEQALADLYTLVLIANASLYNFRIEMPIYTTASDVEIATVDSFHTCL